MKLLRVLLFPLMPLYFFGSWIRNKLFDFGIYKSKEYDTAVIGVGNLSTGGTGKTPMVEYLIRMFKNQTNLAVLSRGYKRKTKGFLLADPSSTYKDIGDEPFQYHSKFSNIQVAVDEKRVHGIDRLLESQSAPNLIILDDAFQHRWVKPRLSILLTSYEQPFFKDVILPTGNLREPRAGYKRADIIIVTKCPNDLSEATKKDFKNSIKPLAHQSLYFSSITYADYAVNRHNESKKLKEFSKFTLVTGIAKPEPLVSYLLKEGLEFDHMMYPDHHNFNEKDLEDLRKKNTILTTEKDFVRLRDSSLVDTNEIFYLPIEFVIDRSEEFKERLNSFMRP